MAKGDAYPDDASYNVGARFSERLRCDRLPGREIQACRQNQGKMVPGEGIEPPTFGLQNRCTTAVLTRPPMRRELRQPAEARIS